MKTENITSFPKDCLVGTKKCQKAKCIFKFAHSFTLTPESQGSKFTTYEVSLEVGY